MKVIITLKEKTGIGRSFDHEYDLKEVLERRHWDAQRWEVINVAFVQPPPTTEQSELWKEAFEELGLQYFYKDDTLDRMRNIIITKYVITRRALTCALDEQQCRDSCDHKEDRSQCPFVTRKQEVPEAVSFAEWCVEFYGWSDTDELWVDNQGEKYTTAELYELYKKQKL